MYIYGKTRSSEDDFIYNLDYLPKSLCSLCVCYNERIKQFTVHFGHRFTNKKIDKKREVTPNLFIANYRVVSLKMPAIIVSIMVVYR